MNESMWTCILDIKRNFSTFSAVICFFLPVKVFAVINFCKITLPKKKTLDLILVTLQVNNVNKLCGHRRYAFLCDVTRDSPDDEFQELRWLALACVFDSVPA